MSLKTENVNIYELFLKQQEQINLLKASHEALLKYVYEIDKTLKEWISEESPQ